MTKFDVKNYLEKIYNVPVGAVRTRIQFGECCHCQAQSDTGSFDTLFISILPWYQVVPLTIFLTKQPVLCYDGKAKASTLVSLILNWMEGVMMK